MNLNNVFSLPIATGSKFDEHLRVKQDSNGNAILAGANDRGVGHLLHPVDGAGTRLMADIVKPSAVSFVFAKITGTASKGQRLRGADGGKFSPVPFGIVKDDDSATTNGTDVMISFERNGIYGFLNSTNAGNADSVFQVGAGGGVINIDDSDAPTGVVLYYDENGISATEGKFLCISPTGADVLVPISDGTFLRVYHDAAAATNGVAVHFDDDGATASQRLLFVSPTNANGGFQSDDNSDRASFAEAIESGTADDVIRVIYR